MITAKHKEDFFNNLDKPINSECEDNYFNVADRNYDYEAKSVCKEYRCGQIKPVGYKVTSVRRYKLICPDCGRYVETTKISGIYENLGTSKAYLEKYLYFYVKKISRQEFIEDFLMKREGYGPYEASVIYANLCTKTKLKLDFNAPQFD